MKIQTEDEKGTDASVNPKDSLSHQPEVDAATLFLGSLLQNHLERACKVADQMGLTLEDSNGMPL